MGAILTKPTEQIRLNYQISDGVDALPLKVKAVLRDALGQVLEEFPNGVWLTHVGGGLFKNSSVTMPDSPEVTAQYTVFDDTGLLEDIITYGVCTDTFVNSNLVVNGSDPDSGAITVSDLIKLGNAFAQAIDVQVVDDSEAVNVFVVEES